MKKFISIALAVVLLVSIFTMGTMAAKPGDQITISYTLAQNPGFANYGAKITYDASALELVSVDAGALSSGGFFDANLNTGIVGFAGTKDVTGSGVLFTATFKVKAGVADGDYPVSITMDNKSTSNLANAAVQLSVAPSANKVTVNTKPAATVTPLPIPTKKPTVAPTATPTPKPTATPTVAPTATPTVAPTATPTVAPTTAPTATPTTKPVVTKKPVATVAPEVVEPTIEPTVEPTPEVEPTVAPTEPTEPTEPATNNGWMWWLLLIPVIGIIIIIIVIVKKKKKE